jgi:ERCC4-type nuclease
VIDKESKLFINSMNQVRKVSASEVLKKYKSSKEVRPSYSDLLKKIEELKKEAEIALAIETFLDCNADKVKVSKRIPKSPKYALGYVR